MVVRKLFVRRRRSVNFYTNFTTIKMSRPILKADLKLMKPPITAKPNDIPRQMRRQIKLDVKRSFTQYKESLGLDESTLLLKRRKLLRFIYKIFTSNATQLNYYQVYHHLHDSYKYRDSTTFAQCSWKVCPTKGLPSKWLLI
jgi:hypothetical protein